MNFLKLKFFNNFQIKANKCDSSFTLEISPFNPQSQSPRKIMRSKMFSINTATHFVCHNSSYTKIFSWTLNRIISNGPLLIDLSANPTHELPEIVVKSNTLVYGLYEFTVQVEIQLVTNIFKNKLNTYVEVIPTGLAVLGIENGIQSISIGFGQTLTFNPIIYSFDFDNLASIANLTFKFYCSPSNNNNYITSSLSSVVDKDLATFKKNSSLEINSCFTSNSRKKIFLL